jgi:hypothetical protein
MAHLRTYTHFPNIMMDAGDARGYDKRVVVDKTDRVVGRVKAAVQGAIPVLSPSSKFLDQVEAQLNQIRSLPLGANMLTAIHASGYMIRLTFPTIHDAITHRCNGTAPNTTRTGGGDEFRRPVASATPLLQLQTLQIAYASAQAAGYNDQDIATAINAAAAATDINAAAAGAPQRNLNITALNVSNFLTGVTPLPTDIQYHYLVYALEAYLPRGSGQSSRVRFDPWNELRGASRRAPVIGLAHELVHAWHNARGARLFTDDDLENEMMTVGLAPFDRVALTGKQRKYTENTFRALFPGVTPRLTL